MKIILLENIRSTHNVGSIFRIASATGTDIVLLAGYTPAPIDRMGRKNEKLNKTALGAEDEIKWELFKTTKEALDKYKGYAYVAVEQTDTAKPYTDIKPDENMMFIFGNEVDGIDKETLSLVKNHIFLPMIGEKESLNVSTCAAVVLYHYNTL